MDQYGNKILSFKKLKAYGSNILDERGLRLGDEIKVMPCEGREMILKLNRTQYEIRSTKEHQIKRVGNIIYLPKLSVGDFSYRLIACSKNKNDHDGGGARFILKSLGAIPFRLNNSFSFEAFLERRDILDIGHNRLKLFPDKSCQSELVNFDEAHDVLSNEKLLKSDLNILLEGETGTGKTILAKRIHDLSGRKGKFIHVNLSSFSENLLESELFGHIKGAFTGACSNKIGAFREANYGTLFLDEIDSIDKNLQTKLLLALDNNLIRPVGGREFFRPEVRLIFASGKKLDHLVSSGEMRADFFYRIASGYKKILSPLRSNPIYIEALCYWFMEKKDVTICPKLMDFYKAYSWPGNIRQILGHLERKKVLTKGRKISYDHLDEQLMLGPKVMDSKILTDKMMTLNSLKRKYINHVYLKFNGNIEASTKILGISRNTLKSNLNRNYAAMIV